MELNNCVYVTGDSNHIIGREAVGNASSVWIFTKSYTPKPVEKNCIFVVGFIMAFSFTMNEDELFIFKE